MTGSAARKGTDTMSEQNKLADDIAKIVVKAMRGAADPGIYGTSHANRMNEITADKASVAVLHAIGSAVPVAWQCIDERHEFRYVRGMVTGGIETRDAWAEGGIAFVGLGPITVANSAPAESVREAVIPNVVLTFTARVDRDWVVHSRIETHKSSFNLAVAALIVLKAEIQKQIDSRSVCPAYREAATPLPQAAEKAAETVSPTAAQINAAAEVMWNDRDARHGGPWSSVDTKMIAVHQTMATARAALIAAANVTAAAEPTREEIEPGRFVDVGPEVLEAAQWAPCSACPSPKFCRHHRVVSCQQAAVAVAEKRATLEDLDQVLSDIYAALGCEHDNEAALIAIHNLKAVAAAQPTREEIASKAREYAQRYPFGSDAQNTLVLLAEWIEDSIALSKPRGWTVPSLATLHQAIIDNTTGDMFWIGEILLNELQKETGFPPAAQGKST